MSDQNPEEPSILHLPDDPDQRNQLLSSLGIEDVRKKSSQPTSPEPKHQTEPQTLFGKPIVYKDMPETEGLLGLKLGDLSDYIVPMGKFTVTQNEDGSFTLSPKRQPENEEPDNKDENHE